MRVLVLGCGPAGLMAAHACVIGGAEVVIASKKRKSYMKGAQYLHRPIPIPHEVQGDPFEVSYNLLGTSNGYRKKVYGESWQGSVSPEDLTESHQGWDIRAAYNWLWEAYGQLVTEEQLDPTRIDEVVGAVRPDITISTIPANMLCMEGHTFGASFIWSSDQPMMPLEQNSVVCNGEPYPAWYRAARIHDFDTVEWPIWSRPPLSADHLWEVPKPTSTNCTCFPEMVRMGRYGKWTKGVLSHEAFYDTVELLDKAQGRLF